MSGFRAAIRPHVDDELRSAADAERRGDAQLAFTHLERAHVLGQASTIEHVRVHCRMLRWALRRHDLRELRGQLFRIAGAATKTVFGLVPEGNTGGSMVSPIAPMPVPDDLAGLITSARRRPA